MSLGQVNAAVFLVVFAGLGAAVWQMHQSVQEINAMTEVSDKPVDPRAARNAAGIESPVRQGTAWCFNDTMLEEALADYRNNAIDAGDPPELADQAVEAIRAFLFSDEAVSHKLIMKGKGQ